MLDDLLTLGAKSAVITSARIEGHPCVVGKINGECICEDADAHNGYFRIDYEEIPVIFHGTGDIFSAVLIGHLLNDKTLKDSTQNAMTVVSQLIERNRNQEDKCLGIPIEQCLDLV